MNGDCVKVEAVSMVASETEEIQKRLDVLADVTKRLEDKLCFYMTQSVPTGGNKSEKEVSQSEYVEKLKQIQQNIDIHIATINQIIARLQL